MAKLNQLIAIEKGIKSRTYGNITSLNKEVQKPELFNGFRKKYLPKNEGEETFPDEEKKVQRSYTEALSKFRDNMSELIDTTARKEWTNASAKADLTFKGTTIAIDVPVTFLLFLEKQMNDLKTFVSNLPVLDTSENWVKDETSDLFRSEPTKTHRTKKVQKPIVLYQATENHPAQTQLITEDVVVGYWEQIKHSGAIPKNKKEAFLKNIEEFIDAVKFSREAANSIDEIETPRMSDSIFATLFGD